MIVPDALRDRNCTRAGSDESLSDLEDFKCFALEYIPSITITAANIILPFVFTSIIAFERYSSRKELAINLTRCVFIRLASLVIAFLSIFFVIRCDYALGCLDNQGNLDVITDDRNCSLSQNEITMQACSNRGLNEAKCPKYTCWETFLGQQFYKLTMTDFIVQASMTFLPDII